MKRMVINAPILFKDENQKQDEEIRCLLEKQFAKYGYEKVVIHESYERSVEWFDLINTRENKTLVKFLIHSDRKSIDLSAEDLILANENARYMFEPEGGVYGVKFAGQIQSIANRALYPNRGKDYPFTIIERAVFYWYEIATHQCFFNGNKRTALFAALLTLHRNGYKLDMEWEKLYDISVDLATHKMNSSMLYKLIAKNTTLSLKKTVEISLWR